MLNILSSMRNTIRAKVSNKEPGLYFYLIFPIAFAFLLTFGVSRIISHLYPEFYLPLSPGLRIHHFAYGFFVLATSGYLALVFNDARAKYLISLLHGFGLGLAFDEFGMWLRLRDDDPARWSYDGFLLVIGLFFLILSGKRGIRMIRVLWPFRWPRRT